jgi:hypothetical protein
MANAKPASRPKGKNEGVSNEARHKGPCPRGEGSCSRAVSEEEQKRKGQSATDDYLEKEKAERRKMDFEPPSTQLGRCRVILGAPGSLAEGRARGALLNYYTPR